MGETLPWLRLGGRVGGRGGRDVDVGQGGGDWFAGAAQGCRSAGKQ